MSKCIKINIPKDICYIGFGKGPVFESYDGTMIVEKGKKITLQGRPFYTIRDEQFIMDLDKKGRIIGIELLDSPKARKPCQHTSKRR
jgi:hypothetical protein